MPVRARRAGNSTWAVSLLWMSLLPVLAVAQERDPRQPPADTAWRPSLGLPLPTIGLPLPSLGLPPLPPRMPATALTTPATEPVPSRGGADRRRGDPPHQVFVPPYFFLPPAWIGVATPGTKAGSGTSVGAPQPPANSGAGRVILDITPRVAAEVYVDGYYVGTPEDYPDGLDLPAGPHALEVRGAAHRTSAASVQVPAGRAITYRATLEPTDTVVAAPTAVAPPTVTAAASPGPPAEPAPEKTPFYIIPGCYLGNVPPDVHNVPAGCDPDLVRTLRP